MGNRTLGYTACAQVSYYSRQFLVQLTTTIMYIPPSTLIFLVFTYLLFLLSVDWTLSADGAWYRPFVVCFAVIALAAWAYREQNVDEL